MPRLSFWAFGLIGGAGGAYAGYHHVYLPRQAALLAADQQMQASKAPYQQVVHAFSQLQAALQKQTALHSSLPASASPARPSSSVWHTNAEKILFFCDVQRVRAALLALPRHLATERDLCAMLRHLGEWEARHCSELNFRVAPLTWSQTAECALCLALYLLCFRIVGPLLRVWQGGESATAAHVQHRAAARITDALGVRVSMTVEAGDGVVSSDGAVQPQYIALNAAHWIEEVGFWACHNNPLLNTAPSAGRTTPRKLLRGAAVAATEPLGWQRLVWSGPSASATAYTTTFAALWRCTAAAQRTRDGDSDAAAALAATSEVSLGYPLLSDPSRLDESLRDAAPLVIPVGISGLPHLLFVGAAHAVPDVRPRRTREEVYESVQRAQFRRSSNAPSPTASPTAMREAQHQPASAELRQWRAARAFPWWRRVWWGGVYGSTRRTDTASLHYHLGRPCVAAAYTSAALAASEAAETIASAAAR